jgi:hypothetical protein
MNVAAAEVYCAVRLIRRPMNVVPMTHTFFVTKHISSGLVPQNRNSMAGGMRYGSYKHQRIIFKTLQVSTHLLCPFGGDDRSMHL